MASSSAPADPTFRSYRSDQAKVYATHRQAYVPAIYETILKHHAATNGDLGLVVDCGCGPGHATRDLALAFDEAIGIDAGAAMIETAREMGGKTRSGKEIRFELCPAEEFSRVGGLAAGSVDLVTVAMAAHWFEMDKFWVECAEVLKPGGTVAIWTRASAFVHPSTPNAAQCREMGRRFAEELAPYEAPASFLSRGMYDNLPLPWDLPTPVSAFPESAYVKHDYDRGGVLSNGETFFGGGKLSTLDDVERGLATASPVTRWREAHPSLVGTEKDVVRKLILGLRAALGDVREVMQGRQHDIPGPSYVKHGPDHEKWVLIPMFPDEFSRGTFRRSEEDLVTCLLSPPRSPIRKAARTHMDIQPSKAHTVIDTRTIDGSEEGWGHVFAISPQSQSSRVALNAMLTGKYASPQLGVRLHGGWRAPGSQSEGEPPTRRRPLLWDDDSQGGRRRGQVSSQYSSPLAPAAPRYRDVHVSGTMMYPIWDHRTVVKNHGVTYAVLVPAHGRGVHHRPAVKLPSHIPRMATSPPLPPSLPPSLPPRSPSPWRVPRHGTSALGASL
ncbi:hypothetical protein B7494_g5117 [Chlorociboria aeruginascens]|nr:hypothetical protein B7494_g5117 [Chlorociboria aeruginascens]